MAHTVFVYGTLLRDERNHHYLRKATRLGAWRTPPRFSLWSLGAYPVACPGGNQRISGEVYRVDDRQLLLLDRLEEVPDYYFRTGLKTPWGMAWIYLQPRPPHSARPLPDGRWRQRRERVLRRMGFESVSTTQGRH